MKKFGIDISRWQGDFNFAQAVAEGVEFVIVKGGGGDSGLYVDRQFSRNYNEAKARSLPTGCYWFSKALTVAEAEKEADYFLANCLKGRSFELPVYIDVEHRAQLALGKTALTAIVRAWCDRLEARGYWVGIYASLNTFRTYLHDDQLQRYAHWVAQWSTGLTYKGAEGVCGMWQFGGEENYIRTNKVAGVTCDQNYMLIDYPAKIKAAGLNGCKATAAAPAPAPAPKPATKSVDELAREVIRGDWGNGAERRKRLTAAGYDYDAVQARVEEILAEGQKPAKKEPAAGDAVKLSGCPLYASATAKTVANKLTGTYYVWSAEKVSGRIRITNKKSNAGKAGQVTGWIDAAQI